MNEWEYRSGRILRAGFLVAMIAAMLGARVASAQQAIVPAPPTNDTAILVSQANVAFAVDLYKQAARDNPGGGSNLVLSPFSVTTALSMSAEGARGRTAEQINFALYFSDAMRAMQAPSDLTGAKPGMSTIHGVLQQFTTMMTTPPREPSTRPTTAPYTLCVSNGLWVQQGYPLEQEYVRALEKYYGVDRVNPLDFQSRPEPSRQLLNLAIAAQTRQKITEFLPSGALSSNTRMLLTAATYFKGSWIDAFNRDNTSKRIFRQDSTHDLPAMLMHAASLDLPYFENDQVQGIALPYSGGASGQDMCMIVLLPRRVDGLPSLEASLLARRIDEWCRSMIVSKVELYLPRFKVTTRLDLTRTLGTLGIRDAFSTENADFTGISPGSSADRLCLGAVLHQSCVEVDEQGSEAAASTAVVGGGLGGSTSIREARPIPFRADHPFIFMIYHNPTGTILFMGRVSNPTS
jgi:serpin B